MIYDRNEPVSWKYVRIGECEITPRTFNLLRQNGIEILGEVAARSDRELLSLAGFGRKALQEVKELIAGFRRIRPDEIGARNWRGQLAPLLKENGEKLEDVTFEWGDIPQGDSSPVLSDREELDREFYPDYGSARGRPFRAYTENHIYFVHDYDGQETVRHIPRHPGSGRHPLHYGDHPGDLYR